MDGLLVSWLTFCVIKFIINISVRPWSAKLIIIDFPSGLNLGAKVIPGNVPRSSCLFVSKFKT